MLTPHQKGTIIMFAGMLWLSPDALLVGLTSADPLTQMMFRYTCLGLLVGVGLLIRGCRSADGFQPPGWLPLLASVFLCASSFGFVYSLQSTTAANTLAIISSNPLWASLLSRLCLGEPVPVRTRKAIVGGLISVGVVFGGSVVAADASTIGGDLCAFGTALGLGCYHTIGRAQYQRNPRGSMLPALVFSGMWCCVISLLAGAAPLAQSTADYGLLLVQGFVVLPFSFSMLSIAPKFLAPAEVSLWMLLEMALGPLWVWLGLGQVPAVSSLIGGLMLLATLGWHARAGIREERNLQALETANSSSNTATQQYMPAAVQAATNTTSV